MSDRFRYILQHSVNGEDLEPLRSGLEDEPDFRLAQLVGAEPLARMLESGNLHFDLTVSQRFFPFGNSLAVLSVYLPEYVSGMEVVEKLDGAGRRTAVEAWRYIGRKGELLTVAMEHAVGLDRRIVVGREDLRALRARWSDLPTWARVAYKQTFDELADLDAGG